MLGLECSVRFMCGKGRVCGWMCAVVRLAVESSLGYRKSRSEAVRRPGARIKAEVQKPTSSHSKPCCLAASCIDETHKKAQRHKCVPVFHNRMGHDTHCEAMKL